MTRKTEMVLLFVIIAAGLCLRLLGLHWGQGYHPGAIGDEIEAYRVALGFVTGEQQSQYIGQPNFKGGKVPGPLWAAFWAIPLRLGGGPEGVMVLMVFLNTIVIYLTYALGKRLLDSRRAILAALCLAVSPWPVYFSVGCFNPEVMAFLGGLLYLALWDVVSHPASRQIFWVCLVVAVMPQFHMFGLFLVPSVLLLVGFSRRQINWKWLVAGLVASLLLYLPYIRGEMQHHWSNTRQFFGEGRSFSFGCLKALTTTVYCLTNVFESAVGRHFADYRMFGDDVFGSFTVLVLFNALSVVLAVLAVGSFLRALARALRGRWLSLEPALATTPAEVFIGVLLILPLLLFILTGNSFNSRYVIGLFPLLFLLPSMLLEKARTAVHWRKLIVGGFVATCVFNGFLSLAFFRNQGRLIAGADYFIPSFRKMEMVYRTLKADTGSSRPIQVATDGFPLSNNDKQALGLRSLARYVAVRERFDPLVKQSRPVLVYRVEPLTNLVDSSDRVVYQGNGIAIVRLASDASIGGSENRGLTFNVRHWETICRGCSAAGTDRSAHRDRSAPQLDAVVWPEGLFADLIGSADVQRIGRRGCHFPARS